MNDIYFFSTVLLAHMDFQASGSSITYLLLVMSLFVFGPLLLRKFIRMPKGLFISSFISYVLTLIIISCLSFRLWTPIVIVYLCFAVVFPYFYIVGFIEHLIESLFGQFGPVVGWIICNQTVILYLVAFCINTLVIFAIIRLILYYKHKVSAKKSQVEQV
jgi:hypothetical protein